MNGVPRPVQSPLISQFRKDFSTLGQVLAKVASFAGGGYRVVECSTCIHDNNQKALFVEISLPDIDVFYIPLETNVLGPAISIQGPPQSRVTAEHLLAWVQGFSLEVQETGQVI